MFTKLWTIKMSDWQRGLVVAVISGPVGILYDWATVANYVFTWNSLIKGAVAGLAGYLIKNFITGANGRILTDK